MSREALSVLHDADGGVPDSIAGVRSCVQNWMFRGSINNDF